MRDWGIGELFGFLVVLGIFRLLAAGGDWEGLGYGGVLGELGGLRGMGAFGGIGHTEGYWHIRGTGELGSIGGYWGCWKRLGGVGWDWG